MLDKTTLAILNSLPFGVYYCDTNLVVQYINQPYARYLGAAPQEIVGRKITDFLPGTRALHVMRSGKEEMYDQCSVLRKKAKQRILVNRIPIKNERREVIGFISQLMSVGSQGWNTVWDKIEQGERVLHRVQDNAAAPESFCFAEHNILGSSERIRHCIEKAVFFAETEEAVLVTGPTGVGKELFASAIHRCSSRSQGPFISINCAAISREFIASELFGYAPGAFTGAMRCGKAGQIELADGGTLFLDEIGDLPLAAQGALLRALETRQVQRINATTVREVDFRLVSATNRDLREMIRSGEFREDLFYRINTLNLAVPPLAERAGDIPDLVRHFLGRFNKPGLGVNPAAMRILEQYSWPGNIRELRNALTYAAVHAKYGCIAPGDLPAELLAAAAPAGGEEPATAADGAPDAAGGGEDSLAERERQAIAGVLRKNRGNLARTARTLGISRTTLYEKIRKYGIVREPVEGRPAVRPERDDPGPGH